MAKIKKIESNLRDLLRKANEKLNLAYSEKTSNPDMDTTLFQNCVPNYKNIMNLIEFHQKNNTSSDFLTYYYLSACFAHIKSSFNGLPENPSSENKDIVLSNEAEIEKLSESLDSLKHKISDINIFNTKNRDRSLKNNFKELREEINYYSDKWKESVAYRKAVYFYNTGISLLEDETSEKDFPDLLNQLKENRLSNSIVCFNLAKYHYKAANSTKDAISILPYISAAKEKLNQLKTALPHTLKRKNSWEMRDKQGPVSKKLRIPFVKKVRFNVSSKPEEETAVQNIEKIAINTSSKLNAFSNQVEQKNQPEEPYHHKAADLPFFVPPKKRKNWLEIPDREELASKKYLISSKLTTTNTLLADEEEMVQHRKQQYEKMLNQVSIDNPYRFYSRLFFDLSTQLKPCSKESSNHTLLTKLSWLTIAKQLLHLSSHESEIDNRYLENIENSIRSLSAIHRKTLAVVKAQKRAEAYPTYEDSDLHSENLLLFFIKEITDYYYGLDVLVFNSAAKHFLDLIPGVINENSVNMHRIETIVQSAYKPIENIFYAKLLRELVKFYTCDENATWNKNTFLPESKKALVNEYLRILTISNYFAELSGAAGQDLKNKIAQLADYIKQEFNLKQESTITDLKYPISAFFRVSQQTEPLPADFLMRTLREHLQYLIKHRADSISEPTIRQHLLLFIQTYCEQEEIHNKSFKTTRL